MIVYLAKTGFLDPLEPFLTDWQPSLAKEVRIMSYSEVFSRSSLPSAAYIFADLERLTPGELQHAASLLVAIRRQAPGTIVLNDPSRSLCRYELLTELHAAGINPFRGYRPVDTTSPARFPVFLRYEHDHTGATSGLLANQDALDRALVRAMARGHSLRDLLIVEFVDTRGPDGLFEKYGAFVVGDRIIPRHLLLDTEWVVKNPGIRNQERWDRELDYVRTNPHEAALRSIAHRARIEYGRIDYALLDGRPVVWEINTNPVVVFPKSKLGPEDLPRQELFIPRFGEALEALLRRPPGQDVVVVPVASSEGAPSVLHRLKRILRRHRRWLLPAVLVAEWVLVPFRRPILSLWKRRVGNPE